MTIIQAKPQRQYGTMGAYTPTAEGLSHANEDIITTFQSGHGYTKTYANGTLTDDTSVYIIGSQSIKLTTDGAGNAINARKTGISPTLDLTKKDIRVWVRCDDTANIDTVSVYFTSDGFSNNAIINFDEILTRGVSDNTWFPITLSFSDAFGTGVVNAVNAIQLYAKDKGSSAVNVWFNGISYIDKQKEGVVSVTFDDGYDDHYIKGKSYMSQLGIRATAYVIPDRVGNEGRMTLANLKELQDVHGWDIAAHSSTNLTTVSATEAEKIIIEIKDYLIKNGFARGAEHFAYPNGAYNEGTIIPLMRKYFTSARTIEEFFETTPPYDSHRLRIYNITEADDQTAIDEKIETAKANHDWLILTFHQIEDTPTGNAISTTKFQATMDKIVSEDIKVKTISEVFNDHSQNSVEIVDDKVDVGVIPEVYTPNAEGMEKYNETILTTFQSGHGYTYTQGGGSSSDDTDAGDFVIGSQSLKIVTDGAGTQTRVTKTGLTPFSIENKNIVITAKIADSDTLDGGNQQVFIGFSSDDFATTNFYQYYNANYALRKTEPGGEWLTMSFAAPDYVGGNPDLTAITGIRIFLRGTGVTTLNINKISLVDKPKEAVITFTFDDGPIMQYTEGKKHLSKYGFPATAYVIRDREGLDGYMSFAQMTELQDVHHWDIAAHSETNFTTLTAKEMELEMLNIKSYLTRNGYKGGDHLAYPQGELNSNIVLPLMKKYFTTGRLSAAAQQEVLPMGGNPYIIKPFSVQASVSVADVQAEIDQAIEEKGWLILVFHRLYASGATGSDYNIADFQSIVDYVNTKGVKVRTVSDVINQNPNAIETVGGKVGIGTTEPECGFHVVSDKIVFEKETDGALDFQLRAIDTSDRVFSFWEATTKQWEIRSDNYLTPLIEPLVFNGVTINNILVLGQDGHIAVGTQTPAASAAFDITSTDGALLLSRMTTTQRDALTAVNGMIIYNTTTNAFNFYENGSWVAK